MIPVHERGWLRVAVIHPMPVIAVEPQTIEDGVNRGNVDGNRVVCGIIIEPR